MTPDERPATPPAMAAAAGRSPVPDARTDDLALPKPPGVFRSFFARNTWIVDSLIVVVFGTPTLLTLIVSLATGREEWTRNPWLVSLAVSGSLIVIPALYVRRRHPLVLVVATAVGILFVTPVFESLNLIPSTVALYGMAVYVSARAAFVAFGALSAVRILAGLITLGGDVGASLAVSTVSVFLMVIATLAGISVGNRKRYVEALLDRAAQLGRERDQQALLSAASERARIAREMHNIVAHSLTVMVALADGADRTVAQNPDRAREAIRQVAETGRVALADMRIVLGVLTPDAPTQVLDAPQPGHDDLDALVASYRSAGMVIVYTVTGAIVADPGIQLAVYRIVQEALTNSLRYAPDPKHAVVTIVYAADGVTVSVADQGQSQVAAPSIGTGHGIVGMRERARGYGGSLEAGPTTAGGWRVRAQIPQQAGRVPAPAETEGETR